MSAVENAPAPQVPKMLQLQNIHLEEFEKAVYSGRLDEAGALLLQNLRRLRAGAQFVGHQTDTRLASRLYTRFAAATVALLANEKFVLSDVGFVSVGAEHAITDLLFRASAFGTSDHLLALLANQPEPGKPAVSIGASGNALAKFLLTYSLRSGFAMGFRDVMSKSPAQFLALWAGMCTPLLTISPDASKKREELLGLHDLFEDCVAHPGSLSALSDAYMYTSYAVFPDKHKAKGTIHRVLARSMRTNKVALPTKDQLEQRRRLSLESSEKPVMMVALEWFTSQHAMYRCYAYVVRQLRKKFRLVAVCRDLEIDEVGKAEFDEWIEVPKENVSLQDLVKRIAELRPDVIYYPSVGMALWWVALASVRLAPVQMMSLGHPASTQSPAMDYVVQEDGSIGDPALFTERLVTIPPASCRFVHRTDFVPTALPKVERKDYPDVVEVAVPAMLCKLSLPFMNALVEARDLALKSSGQKVRFHFFVNMLGLNLYQAAAEIRERLPESLIYERMEYAAYLGHLAKCHVHASPFPFGGTNSNVDSFMLGIPVVTRYGNQPHERFDQVMIRRAGLPEHELVAVTDAEYVLMLSNLCRFHGARNKMRDHLFGLNVETVFYDEAEDKDAFGDAAWLAYRHHEQLQNGPREITLEQLRSM